MHVLLIDNDRDNLRVLSDLLRAEGMTPHLATTSEEALAALRRRPLDVLFLSMELNFRGSSEVLEGLRTLSARQRPGVVLCSSHHTEEEPRVRGLMQRHDIKGFLRRPFPMFDLARTLRAASAPAPTLPSDKPMPALKALANLWCQERSGQLLRDPGEQSARFSRGAPVSAEAMAFAQEAVAQSWRLRFEPGPPAAAAQRQDLTQLLRTHAWRKANPNFARQQPQAVLSPVIWAARIQELQVHGDVLEMLKLADGEQTLKQLARAVRTRPDRIGADLHALRRLGLAPMHGVRKVKARPRPKTAEASPVSAEDFTNALMELKRLRKEKARFETASCWTVLGLGPGTDAAQIDRAAERALQRYDRVANNPGYSDTVHALARDVQQLIRGARAQAHQAPVTATIDAAENEERAFIAGCEAMRRGDWSNAVRGFNAAHLTRVDDPRYMGYLGWAIFNDTAQGANRSKRALELLELADMFDAELDEPQLFLARVEADSGELVRAQARLKRLQGRSPALPGLSDAVEALQQQAREAQEAAQAQEPSHDQSSR